VAVSRNLYCTAYTGIYRTYPGEESDLMKKIGGERDSPSPENVSSFDSERDNIIRLLCFDSRTLHFYILELGGTLFVSIGKLAQMPACVRDLTTNEPRGESLQLQWNNGN